MWLAPLAVLVPIIATPIGVLWTAPRTNPAFPFLIFFGGLALIVTAGHYTYGARVAVVTTINTWGVALLAELLWYAIAIGTSLCGKSVTSAWGWIPPAGGTLAFLIVGGQALRANREPWGVPLAVLLAVVVTILLFAAVPGMHGICET